MNKRVGLFAALIVLSWVVACTLPVEQVNAPEPLRLGQPTLTVKAPLGPVRTATGAEQVDRQMVANALSEATKEPVQAAGAKGKCNRAAPGRPLDLTVPDGETLRPGQAFSKTWRLVNAGTCEWAPGYAVIWFSGEQMGAPDSQFLHESVEPGGSVDVTVDMVAPLQPGVYQSNWMLSDGGANLFGIGPGAQSAFWARIQVVEEAPSATPETLPTPAPTLAVFNGGELTLYLQDWMDLDSGMINTGSSDDLSFQLENEQAVLRPAASTRIAVFGARTPTESDCREVRLSAEPLALDSLKRGFSSATAAIRVCRVMRAYRSST